LNHGDDVVNFGRLRTIAWDLTNGDAGQTTFYLAGVDTTSVEIWIRAADLGALVTDESGDGTCDTVTENGGDYQELDAIRRLGSAHYSNGTGDLPGPSMAGLCAYATDETPVPDHLCTNKVSDMYVIATHDLGDGDEAVVYGHEVEVNGNLCTGDDLELRAHGLTDYEGWVCLASRAVDNVGNIGVSAPIAICYDNTNLDGTPSCWGTGPAEAPSCIDGCSPRTFESLNGGGVIYRKP
jgi:hypothetical protein